VTINDPATGASSTMMNVLTYGAAASDTLRLTQSNPAIPVGSQTPNPIRVSVNTADGVSPVDGATVQWSVDNNATLSLCGAVTCTALTDESGHSEARVTLGAPGTTTVTAQLAPAAYPNKLVQTTLSATTAARSISLAPTKIWGTHGMALSIPLMARVLTASGAPIGGQTLSFTITAGAGTLSPPTVTTGNDGYASSTLQVASLSGEVDAVVCAAGGGIVCPPLNVFQVSSSTLQLQPVSGAQQAIFAGQSFTPLRVRVLDSSSPPNPVFGVPVIFRTMLLLPMGDSAGGPGSEPIGRNPQRVIVGSFQTAVSSDLDGYAAIIPNNGGGMQALDVNVSADPGNGASLQFQMQVLPAPVNSPQSLPGPSPRAEWTPVKASQSCATKDSGRSEDTTRGSGTNLPADDCRGTVPARHP
jgi:hypothetical protein